MSENRSLWFISGIIALVIVNLFGWGFFSYHLAESGYTSEDFLVNWVAAKELIFEGGNPYNPEFTRTTLNLLEARGVASNESVAQFTSPLYTLLLMLPYAMVQDYNLAQTLWMSMQQILLIILILLSVILGNVRPGRITFALLVITTFLGYYAIQPVLQGSTVLFAGVFLLLSLLLINKGREEIAGVFLGLVTIQLPYLILPIILILFWCISHRKRLVLLWFFGILVTLTVLGVFLMPEWPIQYLRILFNYKLFFPASSPGAAFRVWWPGIGSLLAWILAIFSILVLGFEWVTGIKRDFRWLIWLVCLALVLGTWTGIPVLPEFLVVLVLPLVVYTGSASERWGRSGGVVAVTSLLILFLWEWWLVIGNLNNFRSVDNLDLLFPFPVICLIGLYWSRWLYIKPKRLMIEDLRSFENA